MVRYKIANLAFEEMLKGTEVKNIMTATGRVSDYIPDEDRFVHVQTGRNYQWSSMQMSDRTSI